MPLSTKFLRRPLTLLLTSPTTIPFLTLIYVAAGISFVWSGYTLNNEGLLTHYWASWARQDFLPVFFYQKVKPILCALYAPITALGSRATLTAHVIVAATSIPLIAATARALGHRLPNLPAFLIAFSPVYFYGGSAGFSNIDAVVGIVLVFYLLEARQQPVVAGLVAGLLPWVRFELAMFTAGVGLYGLFRVRDWRLLFGLAVFPLTYAITGALYHDDLMWLSHFPPSAPFDPNNPIYAGQHIGLQYLLEPAVALTPATALAATLVVARLARFERAVLAYALLSALAMNVLPILRVGNFGSSQRYSLHILPALALLIGRAMDPWWEKQRPSASALVGAFVLAIWVATRQAEGLTAPLIIITTCAAVLAAAWVRAGELALVLTLSLVVVGPWLPRQDEVTRSATAPYLDPMIAWLDEHPELDRFPLYTNAQLLAPQLERLATPREVYVMAGIDMARELVSLTNPDNGQRERIRYFAATDLYGRMLLPPFAPDDLPSNALLVLRVEPRLSLLLPEVAWSSRLEILTETPRIRMARIRPTAPTTPTLVKEPLHE